MLLRTLEALDQLGDTLRTSTSLYYLGVNAFALGDWAEARARYEAALALGARSDRMEAHSARRGLLQLDLAEGKRPLTAHLMREEAARVYQREDLVYQLYTASSVLNLEILAGFAVEARTCLRQTLASRSDDDPTTCDDLALLAWAELELGDLAAAHVALDEARRRAEAFGSRLVFVLIWRIEGRLALVEQRYQEGLAVVEQAMALAQAMPYPYAEAQARYVAGLLHQTRGEDVKARQAFSAALAIFQRLGERFYAGRIERELAALG